MLLSFYFHYSECKDEGLICCNCQKKPVTDTHKQTDYLGALAAEHQYNFHTYLGRACSVYIARLQIRGTSLVAVRQTVFYCCIAKLDTPSPSGLLILIIKFSYCMPNFIQHH